VISSALHAVRAVRVFGHTWPPAGLSGAVLYLLGVVGLALLLTAFMDGGERSLNGGGAERCLRGEAVQTERAFENRR